MKGKMTKNVLYGVILFVAAGLVSCSGSQSGDHTNFNAFYKDFQSAYKANDIETLRSMSSDQFLESFFFKGARDPYLRQILGELVSKTRASDVEKSDDGSRVISIIIDNNEDDEELRGMYTSSFGIIFSKIEGVWKISALLLTG